MTRFWPIIAVFFVLPFMIFAQNSSDSIRRIEKNYKDLEDSERLKALEQLSKYYLDRAPDRAIEYGHEFIKLIEELDSLEYLDMAASILGEAYFYLDNYERSVYYLSKFLEIKKAEKDTSGIASGLNNLGIVYRTMKKYDEAIKVYAKSLEIKTERNDTLGICNTLNNIGVLYFFDEDYEKALLYYRQSHELAENMNLDYGFATSYLNIGEVQAKLEKFDSAQINLEKSIKLANAKGDIHTAELAYHCLYEAYKAQEDYVQALHYFEKYEKNRATRINKESGEKIAELEAQYDTRQKEREIELLNHQRTNQRKVIYIQAGAFLIILLLALLLFYQYKSKKKANLLLASRNIQVQKQAEELQQLNRTKDKFFSIIAHDLKGAIGGFLSQTQFIADDFKVLSDEDKEELIGEMNVNSRRLYNLLENLLEWSRAQTDNIPYHPQKINVSTITQSIIGLYKVIIDKKRVKVIMKIDADLECFADINMLQLVLRNFLSNAIKYSHPGDKVSIQAADFGAKVRFEVMDEGVGMDNKTLEQLFRIEQTPLRPGTREERGTGLGLLLSKEFVEKMDGNIWVESQPDKGSTFYFTIPKA